MEKNYVKGNSTNCWRRIQAYQNEAVEKYVELDESHGEKIWMKFMALTHHRHIVCHLYLFC